MTAADLLTLAQTYSQALDIALSTAGTRSCSNASVFIRLADGRGCNSRTIDAAAAWFDKNWPDSVVDWPDGVPRPATEEPVA